MDDLYSNPPPKKNPCRSTVNLRSSSQLYCSLLNSVCSQHSMGDVTAVTALYCDTLHRSFVVRASPLEELSGDEEKPAIFYYLRQACYVLSPGCFEV